MIKLKQVSFKKSRLLAIYTRSRDFRR